MKQDYEEYIEEKLIVEMNEDVLNEFKEIEKKLPKKVRGLTDEEMRKIDK